MGRVSRPASVSFCAFLARLILVRARANKRFDLSEEERSEPDGVVDFSRAAAAASAAATRCASSSSATSVSRWRHSARIALARVRIERIVSIPVLDMRLPAGALGSVTTSNAAAPTMDQTRGVQSNNSRGSEYYALSTF